MQYMYRSTCLILNIDNLLAKIKDCSHKSVIRQSAQAEVSTKIHIANICSIHSSTMCSRLAKIVACRVTHASPIQAMVKAAHAVTVLSQFH